MVKNMVKNINLRTIIKIIGIDITFGVKYLMSLMNKDERERERRVT